MNEKIRAQANDSSSNSCEDEDDDKEFKPMSPEEFNDWQHGNPSLSVWRVVVLQLFVGLLMVLVVAEVWRSQSLVLSVVYGAAVVILPGAMFARGVMRVHGVQASITRFLVWELAKLLLAVAMLVIAPKLVAGLNWLAMIGAMIATLNVSWVALLVRPRSL